MAKASFIVKCPKDPEKTNDIILKVQSYGGATYSGGKDNLWIECEYSIRSKLEKEIKDMLQKD